MDITGISGTLFANRSSQSSPAASSGSAFEDMLTQAAGATGAGTLAAPKAHLPLTAEEKLTKLKEALAAFEKEAKMTPLQRARRTVLKQMQLTEDVLKTMPPAQRDAIEDKIAVVVAKLLDLDKPVRTDAAAGEIDPVALLTPAGRQDVA